MATLRSVTEPTTTDSAKTASIADLASLLDAPDLTVVDVRPIAAYNGWRLHREPRGGHVPGAVALPLAWLDRVDEPEIRRLLADKAVAADRRVVVYGADIDTGDARRAASRLADLGVATPAALEGGFAAWAADDRLPVDRLRKHDRLVHIDWLRRVLVGEPAESAPTGRFLLFHVNFGVPEEYDESHLPGAFHLDTNRLEDPVDWNRRSPEALDTALRELGISHDTTVVVYGRDTEGDANEKWPGRRAGQIAATRALLILRYAGVEDVRLLDGGYDAWVQAGFPVEDVRREPVPIAAFGAPIPARPELIVDIDEAKDILADQSGSALVSVRTWREHIGRVSGYNYIGPAGRIRGDVWGNCGSDAYHMQHYRNVDNTMRAYPEIASNWAKAGITADKRVSFYCGTGWRASETWFYAWLQGWSRISVYDGGWFEWSKDPVNNPIDFGDPDEPDRPEGEFAA
jgi:thiosulfate/3-mercaptopyruvate sulfurtransferase